MLKIASQPAVNFRGSVQMGTRNDKQEIEQVVSNINEPEKDVYIKKLDELKTTLEEQTSPDAKFALNVKFGDWFAGGVLKCGKQLSLEIFDLKHAGAEKPIYKRQLPIINEHGDMWTTGDNFEEEVGIFMKQAANRVLMKHRLWEAMSKR